MAVFADLPYELRQQVFRDYFIAALKDADNRYIFRNGLFRVSRQVHAEAAEAAINAICSLATHLRAQTPGAMRVHYGMIKANHILQRIWWGDCNSGQVTTSQGFDLWQGMLKERITIETRSRREVDQLQAAIFRLQTRAKRLKRVAMKLEYGEYFGCQKRLNHLPIIRS